MGLIGSYIGAVWCGATGYYLSPISFLKNPVIWINAMSNFKATHTQVFEIKILTNFCYSC